MRKCSPVKPLSAFIFCKPLLGKFVGATSLLHTWMKHRGCLLEYTDERNRELMKAFRHCLAQKDVTLCPDIWERVANMPSSRFWVSEERAATVIGMMLNGKPLPRMRPNKMEMFEEICRRVEALRQQKPAASLFELVCTVVRQPAPKFYLTPRTTGLMISRIRNGWYQRKYNRYSHILDGKGD